VTALFNGLAAGDWTQSRGLHYGDGVFRTMLVWDAQILDWALHLQKLSADCAALELEMPEASLLLSEALALADGQARAILKLIIMRKAGGRGYRMSGVASDRLLMRYPAPKYPEALWTSGVSAFYCELRLAAQPALAGIKHLNRLEQVLASRHWPDDADEGILCNQAGQPVCGTRSNLFWVSAGKLCTPALNECGVSGMMRSKIMAIASSLNMETVVALATQADLVAAEEVFLSNSLIGIWPLRRLEHREWTAPGSVTSALLTVLQQPRLA
jgi:4-amino-4-deoxychorismate lyase